MLGRFAVGQLAHLVGFFERVVRPGAGRRAVAGASARPARPLRRVAGRDQRPRPPRAATAAARASPVGRTISPWLIGIRRRLPPDIRQTMRTRAPRRPAGRRRACARVGGARRLDVGGESQQPWWLRATAVIRRASGSRRPTTPAHLAAHPQGAGPPAWRPAATSSVPEAVGFTIATSWIGALSVQRTNRAHQCCPNQGDNCGTTF